MDELDEGHPLVGREVEVLRTVLPVAPLADQRGSGSRWCVAGLGHPQDNGAHERMHVDVRFDLEDFAAVTLPDYHGVLDDLPRDPRDLAKRLR
jgi:hypothetical protein